MSDTLFELPRAIMPHPAKFSDEILAYLMRELAPYNRILDPFGGSGKIHTLDRLICGKVFSTELEFPWIERNQGAINANALMLPFQDQTFDCICTSPTYGNRMADTYTDGSNRITYTAKLGRKLHPDNSGSLQWGEKYRQFHIQAWNEITRVLETGGSLILNIKNHIRGGDEQEVTEWHIATLRSLGYALRTHAEIATQSMGYGENRDVRVEYENVITFDF